MPSVFFAFFFAIIVFITIRRNDELECFSSGGNNENKRNHCGGGQR